MLDKETAIKLEATVMEKFKSLSDVDDPYVRMKYDMIKTAVQATILTLQEYEKLNKAD